MRDDRACPRGLLALGAVNLLNLSFSDESFSSLHAADAGIGVLRELPDTFDPLLLVHITKEYHLGEWSERV